VRDVVEFINVKIEKIALEENLTCVYKILTKIEVKIVFGVD